MVLIYGTDIYLNRDILSFICRLKSNWHATIVEAVNYDLKKQLFKLMFTRQTLRWIELLPFVTKTYNTRPKAALGNLTPEQAKLPQNINFIKNLHYKKKIEYERKFHNQKIKFSLGDLVKVVKTKNPFSRGYTQRYDDRTYRIDKIHRTWPVTFSLNGKNGKFYTEQLIKVPENPLNQYYIAETKKIPEKFLRSGKILSYKNLTLIKDKLNPQYAQWKTDNEIAKMKKENILSEEQNG